MKTSNCPEVVQKENEAITKEIDPPPPPSPSTLHRSSLAMTQTKAPGQRRVFTQLSLFRMNSFHDCEPAERNKTQTLGSLQPPSFQNTSLEDDSPWDMCASAHCDRSMKRRGKASQPAGGADRSGTWWRAVTTKPKQTSSLPSPCRILRG